MHMPAIDPLLPIEAYTLEQLGLVDAPKTEAFSALGRLARRIFDVPVVLISVIEEERDRQIFPFHFGLSEPWASRGETPLSHSFCQYVKKTRAPLVVDDACAHPVLHCNRAIEDLNVKAYLGVPFFGPSGEALGALCIIDDAPRAWSPDDVQILAGLARCVSDEVLLRASLINARALGDALERTHERTCRYNAMREMISMAFLAPDMTVEERFDALLESSCHALCMEEAALTRIDGDSAAILFAHGGRAKSETQPMGKTLSRLVVAGQSQIYFHDSEKTHLAAYRNLSGSQPRSYIAAPLILDGMAFGTLELSSAAPRAAPWSDEDMSIVTIGAMLAASHLAMLGGIGAGRSAQTQMRQISDREERARKLLGTVP